MTDWFIVKDELKAVDELLLMLINEDATEYGALIGLVEDNYRELLERVMPLIDKEGEENGTC